MKLVFPLEKGRKPLPDGTIRTYGGNKFKKINGKWEYLSGKKGTTKTEGKRKGRKKDTDTKPLKSVQWDVSKHPTEEYLKQVALGHMKKASDSTLTRAPSDLKAKLDKHGVNSLSDLYDAAANTYSGNREFYQGVIHDHLQNPAWINNVSDTGLREELYELRTLTYDAAKQNVLSDPNFDGTLEIFSPVVPMNDGISVKLVANVGEIPYLTVPWDQMDLFIDSYVQHPTTRKKLKSKLKTTPEYKKWQAEGGDPKVKAAADDFEKRTGLEVNFGYTARRQVKANPKALNKIAGLIEQLTTAGDIDFKRYNPPDGKKLKVAVGAAGRGVAGFYTESNQTINISPSYPGTIVHEVGHYFWERHKDLQKDFMQWVKDSGLRSKLDKVLFNRVSDAEFDAHVDHVFNSRMKKIFEKIDAGKNYSTDWWQPIATSQAAKDGLADFTAAMRAEIKFHKKTVSPKQFSTMMTNMAKSMNQAGAESTADAILSYYPNHSRTKDEITQNLLALKNALNALHPQMLKALDESLGGMAQESINPGSGANQQNAQYRSKPRYWNEPTEIFARTFRNYVAYKGKKQLRFQQGSTDYDTYGWGFPAVDPDEKMLTANNGQLEKLLKKHLGSSIVKSIMRLAILLEKGRDDDDDEDDDEEQSERDKEFEREQKNEEAREARKSMKLVMKSSMSRLAQQLAEDGLYKEGQEKTWTDADEVDGTQIELEHTDDIEVARQIAMDHLAEDADYYRKLKQMEKAKPYPDGTIRSHGGRKMKKVEGGWVPVTEGKTESERGEDKSRHKAEKKPMVVKGSPEVLQALKKVDRGTRVFLDDLKGKDKKTFNSLTKNGLVKWTHFADEEYVCELTEAGKNAVAKGIVTERKAKRPKNKMKR